MLVGELGSAPRRGMWLYAMPVCFACQQSVLLKHR